MRGLRGCARCRCLKRVAATLAKKDKDVQSMAGLVTSLYSPPSKGR